MNSLLHAFLLEAGVERLHLAVDRRVLRQVIVDFVLLLQRLEAGTVPSSNGRRNLCRSSTPRDRRFEALDHRVRLLSRDHCPPSDETGIVVFDEQHALLLLVDEKVMEIQMIQFPRASRLIAADMLLAFERRGR
jgi:hypothetical protein